LAATSIAAEPKKSKKQVVLIECPHCPVSTRLGNEALSVPRRKTLITGKNPHLVYIGDQIFTVVGPYRFMSKVRVSVCNDFYRISCCSLLLLLLIQCDTYVHRTMLRNTAPAPNTGPGYW